MPDNYPSTCVIYTNGSQECERVAELITSLGGKYQEYKLNCHFTQRAFEQEFGEDATYPQVAIGAKHIGHLKDLLQFMKREEMVA